MPTLKELMKKAKSGKPAQVKNKEGETFILKRKNKQKRRIIRKHIA